MRLGRPSKVSVNQCNILVSIDNPLRIERVVNNITFLDIPIPKGQLQRKLKEYTNHGQRYKSVYITKTISKRNLTKRVEFAKYCTEQGHSLEDYWRLIFWTDEVHSDPSSELESYILREEGHRYDPENIQYRGPNTGNKLHCYIYVNWDEKARPKQRQIETQSEYSARLMK